MARDGFIQSKSKQKGQQSSQVSFRFLVYLIGMSILLALFFRAWSTPYSFNVSSPITATTSKPVSVQVEQQQQQQQKVVEVFRVHQHQQKEEKVEVSQVAVVEEEEIVEVSQVVVEEEKVEVAQVVVVEEESAVAAMENATLVDALSSCLWSPLDSNTVCTELLSQHMSTALIQARKLFFSKQNETYGSDQNTPSVLHRRWLLFGDSTMVRLILQLNQYLINDSVEQYTKYRSTQRCNNVNGENENSTGTDFQCSHLLVGRCERMEQFHLSRLPTIEEWRYPNFIMGEGPHVFGLENPYCTDCSGCDSEVVSCKLIKDDLNDKCDGDDLRNRNNSDPVASYTGPSYGGFFSVEFARDVELQTSEYSTTQENLLSKYIADEWNSYDLVYEFGRPICVVSAGHHDVAVPNISLDIYVENVQWYLELLLQQCDYIIWISSTAPGHNEYAQKIEGTYVWNMAVLELVLNSTKSENMRDYVFFLDVYNASRTFAMDDNLHMNPMWYKKLASFFENVMKNLTI